MNKAVSVVFAYSEVGYVCLEEMIAQGADIAAVFTHPDDPNENIWFRSCADLASRSGIPVRAVSKISDDDVKFIEEVAPDFIFSFYYRAMIPNAVLKCAKRGAYNMHGALLPKYRGRACVNWAVINGERETGATLHVMTDKADSGDILSQRAVPIAREDTAHDVFLKVADAARGMIHDDLASIFKGTIKARPQDESQATAFGRRTPADGKIDWTMSAERIYDLVRGVTHPFPGAFTELDGKKLFIWRAETAAGNAAPGEAASRDPLTFGTGDGLIVAKSWQFEGEEEHDER